MKPMASFVIPVYNGQSYIVETLKSCLEQSMKHIEAVVVDDGSTDHTNEFVLSMIEKDPRIRLVTLKSNCGRSMARNMGVEESKTDILMMLDADDLALKHRAKLTVNFFNKHKDVGIVSGCCFIANEIGTIEGTAPTRPFEWSSLKETGLTFVCHSTMAIRKSVFDKVRYTDGDYSRLGIDDWKFQVDAYKAGVKFGYIEKGLAIYRQIPKDRDEKLVSKLKSVCLN